MLQMNGLQVLEQQDIIKSCPSFYATHAKDGVSDKYAFLNTREIATTLWGLGWYPVFAKESRSIILGNKGFTRHVVRWAHKDFQQNGERIELVGVNSHNRASAFKFMAGIFRLVCSNGMIAQTADFGSFSIRHMGNISDQVEEAVSKISNAAGALAGRMNEFKQIELTADEQGVFASSAHQLMYDEPETAPIKPLQLLTTRRTLDAQAEFNRQLLVRLPKPDLWTTFNVVQENMIKGGIRGINKETNRRVKTRKINSIDKDVKLNQALWSLTERMAELKRAAA